MPRGSQVRAVMLRDSLRYGLLCSRPRAIPVDSGPGLCRIDAGGVWAIVVVWNSGLVGGIRAAAARSPPRAL